MAFTLENLTIATNNMKAGVVPALWFYYNEANDSVTATSFFNAPRLTVGDIIEVIKPDNTVSAKYRVSAKTASGLCTVVKLAVEYLNANVTETVTAATALYDDLSTDVALSILVTEAAGNADTFTATVATSTVTTASKPLANGVVVRLTTVTTLPGGLSTGTDYYVVNANGTTCQLAATFGGDAITITNVGTGAHTMTTQADFFMLADGGEGQRKYINFKTDGTLDAVVIPENFADGNNLTFGTAGETAALIFLDGEWNLLDNNGGAVA